MAGTSNESGVVDDGNFWRFEWLASYVFGNFRDKTSTIVLYDDMHMLPIVGL